MDLSSMAGRSAARLARRVRDAEVGGSNPLAPTIIFLPLTRIKARDTSPFCAHFKFVTILVSIVRRSYYSYDRFAHI